MLEFLEEKGVLLAVAESVSQGEKMAPGKDLGLLGSLTPLEPLEGAFQIARFVQELQRVHEEVYLADPAAGAEELAALLRERGVLPGPVAPSDIPAAVLRASAVLMQQAAACLLDALYRSRPLTEGDPRPGLLPTAEEVEAVAGYCRRAQAKDDERAAGQGRPGQNRRSWEKRAALVEQETTRSRAWLAAVGRVIPKEEWEELIAPVLRAVAAGYCGAMLRLASEKISSPKEKLKLEDVNQVDMASMTASCEEFLRSAWNVGHGEFISSMNSTKALRVGQALLFLREGREALLFLVLPEGMKEIARSMGPCPVTDIYREVVRQGCYLELRGDQDD